MMQLSKRISARTETFKINQMKKDFATMNDRYREIRGGLRYPMTSCYWCKHKFVNGEMIAIVIPEKGRNRVLCQSCADQAK